MPSLKTFIGGAVANRKVYKYTLTGTWVAGDTITLTSNGKSLVMTVGTTVTLSTIAGQWAQAIGATDVLSPAPATGYSINVGGRQIPEFNAFTAYSDVAVVYVQSAIPGFDFTVSATKSSASGVLTLTSTTQATGPYHLDNAANYAGGVLPAAGDTVSATGSYDMLFGLEYFFGANIGFEIDIDLGLYSGQIGLPPINTRYNADLPYTEYLPTFFKLYNPAASGRSVVFRDSTGLSASSDKPIYLWIGAEILNLRFDGSRGIATNNVFIKGTTTVTGTTNLSRGNIDVAAVTFAGDVYFGTQGRTDADIKFQGTCGFSGATKLEQLGGNATVYGTLNPSGVVNQIGEGATLTLAKQTYSANPFSDFESSGKLIVNAPVPANSPGVLLFGTGEIDFRGAGRSAVWGAPIIASKGSSIRDPNGVAATGGYGTLNCTMSDLAVADLPRNKLYTPTAIP